MATFGDLFARLNPDSNVRGRQFEGICRWFLSNDPRYRDQFKRIWLWDEWPERWGPDRGTDLVAEHHNGSLWAIQAKAYDPDYYVKKSDVDSFLSDSNRPQVSYRLLIATTNSIGRGPLDTIEGQEKPVGLILRSDLEKADVIWPTSPDDLRAPRPRPKTPRPHNQEAIDAVVAGFEETDRGQLVMACGTGKTLIGLWVTEQLQAQRTLVLLPSLSLLAQTLREWTANTRRPFTFLPVCSDETVRGEDHMVSHTAELGMPVTTDPTDIAAFLRKRSQPSVVFATYQSSPKIAEAFEQGQIPRFDLVIADEAHRVAGRVSSDFATVLDPDAIRSRRRLFMTATPRYFTGRVRQEAKREEFEIASMDDKATFGPVFHQLSFGEAIDRGLLTNYQVVIVGIDDPTYEQYVEQGRFVTRDGTKITDARTLAAHISLAKAMRDFDLRRTISFHSRVKSAKTFASEFPEVVAWMPEDEQPVGELVCDAVSGDMPSGQRDVRLDRLRHLDNDQRGLLTNARCLGEGVDVPTLDGVAFIDPKGSLIDIIQAVGRAIRRAEDKMVGTIVLPVYVGDTADRDAALHSSAFKPIWSVLKALRAHDEQMAEQLDELRRQIGRQGPGDVRLPGRIRVDLPISVSEGFARAFDVRLVEQSTASWDFWFGLLHNHVQREGHALVPAKHHEAGHRLGGWISAQRESYKNGRLGHDRVALLEALPGWVWDVLDSAWEEGFGHLTAYARREEHARVPSSHVEDGFRLGGWVSNQRTRRSRLRADQTQRLEALPRWSWDVKEAAWPETFATLQDFANREGHARVPSSHIEGSLRLGAWVINQRQQRSRLDADQIRRLEALPGWSWHTKDDAFDSGLALLRRYVAREGHALVPRNHIEDGFQLGLWVTNQRPKYRRGDLAQDRAAMLEGIEGWVWDVAAEEWRQALLKLDQYVRREGHARVPRDTVEDGFDLGNWVQGVRTRYRKGRVPSVYAEQLEQLTDWAWDPHAEAWERAFSALRHFVATRGHTVVPPDESFEGVNLYHWVRKQRSEFATDRLDGERARRLESIHEWVWNPDDEAWRQAHEALLRYVEDYGNAEVPQKHIQDGFKLGLWVSSQRSEYRKGRLASDKVEKLEAINGWVWVTRKAAWEQGFSVLKGFAAREGHTRFASSHVENGFRLGQWVNTQRGKYNRGELDPDAVQRFESLPGWTWDVRASWWEAGIAHLDRFVKREGHAVVPGDHEEGDAFPLGRWVSKRRSDYRRGKLRSERVGQLENFTGWTWDPVTSQWEQRYDLLRRYVEREGNARVPQAHEEGGVALGSWVTTQRIFHRKGKLAQQRRDRLESLPGWTWDARPDA